MLMTIMTTVQQTIQVDGVQLSSAELVEIAHNPSSVQMTGGETVVDGGGGYGQTEDVPVTGGEVMMDEGGY